MADYPKQTARQQAEERVPPPPSMAGIQVIDWESGQTVGHYDEQGNYVEHTGEGVKMTSQRNPQRSGGPFNFKEEIPSTKTPLEMPDGEEDTSENRRGYAQVQRDAYRRRNQDYIRGGYGEGPASKEENRPPGYGGGHGNKAMDDQSEDTQVLDQETDNERGQEEPLGAQVLRALHGDASSLLEEYDGMMGPLEHEDVKGHLHSHLRELDKFLSHTEKMFGKHYKDLSPLDGTMEEDEEDPELEGEEDVDVVAQEGDELPPNQLEDPSMQNGEMPDYQDPVVTEDDEGPDDALEADGDRPLPPTPEEALEGMRREDDATYGPGEMGVKAGKPGDPDWTIDDGSSQSLGELPIEERREIDDWREERDIVRGRQELRHPRNHGDTGVKATPVRHRNHPVPANKPPMSDFPDQEGTTRKREYVRHDRGIYGGTPVEGARNSSRQSIQGGGEQDKVTPPRTNEGFRDSTPEHRLGTKAHRKPGEPSSLGNSPNPEERRRVHESREARDIREGKQTNPPKTPNNTKSLFQDHEMGKLTEAHGFLGELAQTRDFSDMHRMKAYHFHKSLEPIGMLGVKADPMGEWDDFDGEFGEQEGKLTSKEKDEIQRESNEENQEQNRPEGRDGYGKPTGKSVPQEIVDTSQPKATSKQRAAPDEWEPQPSDSRPFVEDLPDSSRLQERDKSVSGEVKPQHPSQTRRNAAPGWDRLDIPDPQATKAPRLHEGPGYDPAGMYLTEGPPDNVGPGPGAPEEGPDLTGTGLDDYDHEEPKAMEGDSPYQDEPHPHYKAVGEISDFFRGLSLEKAFGDPHRTKAAHYYKVMEPICATKNCGDPDVDARTGMKGIKEDEVAIETEGQTQQARHQHARRAASGKVPSVDLGDYTGSGYLESMGDRDKTPESVRSRGGISMTENTAEQAGMLPRHHLTEQGRRKREQGTKSLEVTITDQAKDIASLTKTLQEISNLL